MKPKKFIFVVAIVAFLAICSTTESYAYSYYHYTYFISQDGSKHYTYYYYNRNGSLINTTNSIIGNSSDKGSTTDASPIKQYIINKFGSKALKALCIAEKESGFNSYALHQNNDSFGSVDAGVFQINLHWHPYVSRAQALDWRPNIDLAYEISNSGKDWSPWSTNNMCNGYSI